MDKPAEEIHQLGLAEVARIRGEMLAVKQQVGFKGDLDAFFSSWKTIRGSTSRTRTNC